MCSHEKNWKDAMFIMASKIVPENDVQKTVMQF
jgi:hypothetical protein